jgi:phage-related protein
LLVGFELMRQGIINIIQGLGSIISGMLSGNLEQWQAGFDQFVTGVVELIAGFALSVLGWIEVMVSGIIGFISGMVTGVISFFQNLFNELVGGSLIPDLVNDILKAIQGLSTDFLNLIGTMLADTIKKIQGVDWAQLGKDMIHGMIDGVGKMGNLLGKAIVNLVNEAIDFFKTAFGIASAARKQFPDLGANMAAGVQLGWARQFGAGLQIPGVVAGGAAGAGAAGAIAGGRHDHWNLTIHSNARTEDVAANYALMQTMSGAR